MDALDPQTREELSDLRAMHSWEASRQNVGEPPATEVQKRERPPVSHPMVRSHPVTGRKALYIGIHTGHIEGRAKDEGHAYLNRLLRRATKADFIYTHKWRKGDLVLWDNRCCCTARSPISIWRASGACCTAPSSRARFLTDPRYRRPAAHPRR